MKIIPYGRQSITDADIDAVVRVMRSDFLTQGPQVPSFEQAVANYVGVRNAVATNSATSALHLACLALGLGAGDLLWTSTNSFVASANCALYCGADIDFVDIDPRTYNLCLVALQRKLEHAQSQGKLPKVLVAVHFAGQSCDMDAISGLARKYNFKVIEDASHAIGGRWQGQAIGACAHSDMTVFSFHPVKIITTAEGGLVTTNDAEIATRLIELRSHGITRDKTRFVRQDQGQWYYEQLTLGFNYRMTELQAALGEAQLGRLDQFVAARHNLVERYNSGLADLPLQLPWVDQRAYSAYHLYVIQLLDNACLNRREFFDQLRAAGILVNVHYIPIHTQPYYQGLGFETGSFPNAEAYYERAISLPIYAELGVEEQDYIIAKLKELLK